MKQTEHLQEIMQEQKILMDKLGEEAESKCNSVTKLMDKWLREQLFINSDLQIHHAKRVG